MRKYLFIMVAFCLLLPCSTGSAEPPCFLLDEGTNEIVLTIANNYSMDIKQMRVEFDQKSLPEWVTVQNTVQTIDIPKGQQAQKKLSICLTVKNAPAEARAEILFTLKDAVGNNWNFKTAIQVTSNLPTTNILYDNYPNPFNPVTTISYFFKENLTAKLIIYNVLGQKVRTLVDAPQSARKHLIQWDACNDNGQRVSSGVYFYRISAGYFSQTKRMILME
jgi:hypothetical protein